MGYNPRTSKFIREGFECSLLDVVRDLDRGQLPPVKAAEKMMPQIHEAGYLSTSMESVARLIRHHRRRKRKKSDTEPLIPVRRPQRFVSR